MAANDASDEHRGATASGSLIGLRFLLGGRDFVTTEHAISCGKFFWRETIRDVDLDGREEKKETGATVQKFTFESHGLSRFESDAKLHLQSARRKIMPEQTVRCSTIEEARNKAVQWLVDRNVCFGPSRSIVTGNLAACQELLGKETGVCGHTPKWWRLRLDHDLVKGLHFNVEFGKGAGAEKVAFCFPGGTGLLRRLANARSPR